MSSSPSNADVQRDSGAQEGFAQHARETAEHVATHAADFGHNAADHYVKEPAKDLIALAKAYAKDHPDVAACWAFGLGVLVGWKLKP